MKREKESNQQREKRTQYSKKHLKEGQLKGKRKWVERGRENREKEKKKREASTEKMQK